MAKEALKLDLDGHRIPYTDIKPLINRYIFEKWQRQWNENTNRLYAIKPILGEWKEEIHRSRKDEVLLTRLHIGHTRLTHNFLLTQEDQPKCTSCSTPLTVKHILVKCNMNKQLKQHFIRARNMKEVFDNNDTKDIMSFLRETGLYQKL